jgi:hypothetical protein
VEPQDVVEVELGRPEHETERGGIEVLARVRERPREQEHDADQ